MGVMKLTTPLHLKLKLRLTIYRAVSYTCKDLSIRGGGRQFRLETMLRTLIKLYLLFCRWLVVLKYLDTLKREITAPEILNKVGFHLVLSVISPWDSLILLLCNVQLEYFVHRQKYLELLSWQGGGEQRMAFPPWKPNTALETASMDSCGKIENEAESNIEMSILVKELNTLKTLCSAAVSH